MFSGGAWKGLVEVLSRMSHAGRMCLAEQLSRGSHAESICLAGVFSRISHDVIMNASGRREHVRQPSGRACSSKYPFHVGARALRMTQWTSKCPFRVDENDSLLKNYRFAWARARQMTCCQSKCPFCVDESTRDGPGDGRGTVSPRRERDLC